MRRKQSFILTILPNEETDGDLRGRIQSVSDRTTRTFKCVNELEELIYEMVKANNLSSHNVQENNLDYK